MSSPSTVRYRTITVWNQTNGDIEKVVRDATERQLREIEEQYDEPWYDIEVEE